MSHAEWKNLTPDADETFGAVAEWLATVEQQSAVRRPRRYILGAALIVVTLAACVIPVQQTERLGWLFYVPITGNAREGFTLIGRQALPNGLVFATPVDGEPVSTIMTVVGIGIADSVARHWSSRLRPLAAGSITVEPLDERVRRRAYSAALRSITGVHFGGDLDTAEVESRIRARLDQLPGATVAMKIGAANGGTDLVVVPGTDNGTLLEVDSARDDIVLMILKRKAHGPPDTLWIDLNGEEYRRGGEAERTALVRAALRKRGLAAVDIVFERGVVSIRVREQSPR